MSDFKRIEGLFPELPVPFEEDGAIDWFSFGRLLDRCFSAGADGVLVCGRLSERGTLSLDEKSALAGEAASAAGRDRAVVFGLSHASGPLALKEAASAYDAGVDALLLSGGPSKSLPELFRMARALRRACPLPLVVLPAGSDVPARSFLGAASAAECGVCFCVSTLSGALSLDDEARACSVPLFAAGDEPLFAPGAFAPRALFSPLAACFPARCSALLGGRPVRRELPPASPLLSRLFAAEDGAAALKYALSRTGLCAPTVRLPLALPPARVRELIDGISDL